MSAKFIWVSLTALACTISLLSGFGMGMETARSTGPSLMACFYSMTRCDFSSSKSSILTQSRPIGSSSSNICPSFVTSSLEIQASPSGFVRSSSGMTALQPFRFQSPSEIPCSMYAQENLPFKSSTETEELLWAF